MFALLRVDVSISCVASDLHVSKCTVLHLKPAAAGFLHLEKLEQDLKRRLQHGLMQSYKWDYYETHRLQLLHRRKNTLCCSKTSQSKPSSTACKRTLKCHPVVLHDTAPNYSHDEEETSILQGIPSINICSLGESDIFG